MDDGRVGQRVYILLNLNLLHLELLGVRLRVHQFELFLHEILPVLIVIVAVVFWLGEELAVHEEAKDGFWLSVLLTYVLPFVQELKDQSDEINKEYGRDDVHLLLLDKQIASRELEGAEQNPFPELNLSYFQFLIPEWRHDEQLDHPFEENDGKHVVVLLSHVSAEFGSDQVAGDAETNGHNLEGHPLDVDFVVIQGIVLVSVAVFIELLFAEGAAYLDVGQERRGIDNEAIEDEELHHHPTLGEEYEQVLALHRRVQQHVELLVQDGADVREDL